MNIARLLLCTALAVSAVACGDTQRSATPPPAATSAPAAPEPGSASGESPAVTASSAAAAAPECKDLAKADPKTCQPGATGNPSAK